MKQRNERATQDTRAIPLVPRLVITFETWPESRQNVSLFGGLLLVVRPNGRPVH